MQKEDKRKLSALEIIDKVQHSSKIFDPRTENSGQFRNKQILRYHSKRYVRAWLGAAVDFWIALFRFREKRPW